ncbi:DUF2125 domain-containing protein [Thalassococcus lentus]|uniref:DUF2125 domain-containing protein n=1 Tax=Thalassococcus lentus TaxID=1210524 RepID=A0ABT4XT74_9RHOB|nr:DUF2125 domain-containing protein [Thalassococcus lentus]MDA7425141.1 DUF2125 domain-containing protein [Thalassococcus lentus]
MKKFTGISALALAAMTQHAAADVTPQQVWDNLSEYVEGFGYDVQAQPAASGDDLIVSNVTMSMALPEGEGNFSFSMDQLTLRDRGDGSVSVGFPEVMPITVVVNDGEQVEITVDYTHDDLQVVVSGDPDAMNYDYTANMLGLALSKLMVDGEMIPDNMARMNMTMGPIEGRSASRTEDSLTVIEQVMDLGDVNIDFAANDPDSEEGGNFAAKMVGVSFEGDSILPEGFDLNDMAAAIAAGFAGGGIFSHQGSSLEFFVTERSGNTSGNFTSGAGSLEVDVSDEAIVYAVQNSDFTMEMTTPDVPFPINAQMAESGFNIAIPIQPGQGPQEAALGLKLVGFETSNMIWGMLDPAAILPRDPATIVADLTAQVTPFLNLMDPADMEKLENGEAMPGELNALTLNDLTVEAAGSKLTGKGAFTFDNTDLESFDGLPRPEGQLDIAVQGHNGLIDKLIQMGLLAEEDAMGARMMLSMFTVPGAEEDSATSTIEVNAEGHVLANGQRIK